MLHEKEYILYCDESIREGPYYSNFYGGVLVSGTKREPVSAKLSAVKARLNLSGEVKWTKVTAAYLPKYIELMDAFFDELKAGSAKVRIMFRQNTTKPRNLTPMQKEQGFYILYYEFIKHGFGFASMPVHSDPVGLRLFFDQFPDTGEQIARFRGYLLALNKSREFIRTKLRIPDDQVTEVRSHDHVLLQCLDVVLGAMAFRLNDLHRAKLPGSRTRGSRTIAKEKLYKHIHKRICEFKPHFNIGISTGGGPEESWTSPYRHWRFVPSDHEFDGSKTKP